MQRFEVGTQVMLTSECEGGCFRNDVFTVVGQDDEFVQVTVVLFGRAMPLVIPPELLRPVEASP